MKSCPLRFLMLLALLVLLPGLSACRITDLPLWKPIEQAQPSAFDVERIQDVLYHDATDADRHSHSLDLYLPRGANDYPVVVLFHGGAWMMGDNRCCGLYPSIGEHLARNGIGAVLPNYRLSPCVRHPEHVKDAARAVAWTRRHIGKHGGRPDQLFLAGHSAGGHLVALLATNEKYLRAEGCAAADIKGVIGVSGVYRIPLGSQDVLLGGKSALAFRLDEIAPLRTPGGPRPFLLEKPWSVPLRVNVFGLAFGDQPAMRADASPVEHVRPGLPPFLLLSAANELPLLAFMAEEMHTALRAQGCDTTIRVIPERNHNSIMFRAVEASDPTASAMISFVRERSGR